jgi:very-short-patch-repair endonuclease
MRRRIVFNSPYLKHHRKQLRNKATEAELILWSCLKDNKLGYKFIRQYSVEGYVVDFYCPEYRLAVEIDGETHKKPDQIKYDQYRTKLLSAWGIRLIRFWNWEVKNHLTSVLHKIRLALSD